MLSTNGAIHNDPLALKNFHNYEYEYNQQSNGNDNGIAAEFDQSPAVLKSETTVSGTFANDQLCSFVSLHKPSDICANTPVFTHFKLDGGNLPVTKQNMLGRSDFYSGSDMSSCADCNNGAVDQNRNYNDSKNCLPYQFAQYSPLTTVLESSDSNTNNCGLMNYESLQQKVSLKKQSLDFLQGGLTSPIEVSQDKKYITNTERIQVPSSDHVAEIVGKNGQRIKQLREQLKVWVKTPTRNEAPIFEVTGIPEKLAEAKRAILTMSEHFTRVHEERKQHRSETAPRLEDRLYVDQDKVGLIVGANGQTVRWIQQLSDTQVSTPRKLESVPGMPPPQTFFTISGAPDRVKFAKQLICEYVTLRCQGLWLDPSLEPCPDVSKLVREFHRQRQAEDGQWKLTTQRRGDSGERNARAVNPELQAQPRQTRPNSNTSSATYADRYTASDLQIGNLLRRMDELWSQSDSQEKKLAAATAAAAPGASDTTTAFWNQMMCIGEAGPAMRFPATDAVPNGRQQQQQCLQYPTRPPLEFYGPPPAPFVVSGDVQASVEQKQQQLVGWM